MTELVLREDKDGVATLTLNRPEVLNALSAESFRALRAHAEAIAVQGEEIGCVVLRGTGKSFCVGADLKAFKERKATDPDPTPFNRATMSYLADLPQPFIASVHGHCVTGGLELALTADMIIAADNSRFADTHQKWGLHAGWGLTQRLPRRAGTAFAKDMMFSGRTVLADEALRVGLVNRVVPAAELDAVVQEFAVQIAQHPHNVTRWNKRMINGGSDLPLDEALVFEIEQNPGRNADLEDRLNKGGF
jgi:enoyl-CoA hydratase